MDGSLDSFQLVKDDFRHRITHILAGHSEDYAWFLDHYGPSVFRLVARLVHSPQEAEEITQDAFMKAYQHLDRFSLDADFYPWIARIAYNEAISHLRRQHAKYVSIDDEDRKIDLVADDEADEALADARRAAQLKKAIEQLKPDERTLLTLYYYDQRSVNDIAYVLGISQSNANTRLHRIRKKLYLLMNNEGK